MESNLVPILVDRRGQAVAGEGAFVCNYCVSSGSEGMPVEKQLRYNARFLKSPVLTVRFLLFASLSGFSI